MNVQRDNIKAGIFVVVGLALALVIIFTLADFQALFEGTRQVKVYYPISHGLQGLREGASVTLGDQPIGAITDITNWPENGPVQGQIVTLEVPSRYELFWTAKVELNVPTIGTGASLNFNSVGTEGAMYDPEGAIPDDAVPPHMVPAGRKVEDMPWFQQWVRLVRKDDPDAQVNPAELTVIEFPPYALPGGAPTSPFTRQLGIEETQRAQIQRIIENVDVVTAQLRRDLPVISEQAQSAMTRINDVLAKSDPIIENVTEASANVRDISRQWKDASPDMIASVNDSLKKVNEASESARLALADAQQLLADKDPEIRQTITNVRDITQDVKDKTFVQVTEALDKANTALADLQTVSGELKSFAVGQRPVLERAVANLQITASQLKLAAIEVRRSPWRLIYQPGDKELEYDNLYDSARSFALAAEALTAASQSLRAVSENKAADPQQLQQMMDHLEAVMGKFKQTEQRFWNELEGRKPPQTPQPPPIEPISGEE